uniref:Apple domain-containing protein n=1 Tax=Tetranychus urticae TaxID=32264 RepID=T1KP62_TETUR
MSVSADTFEKMKPIKTNYGFDCVHKLSKIKEYISVIIYRPSDSSCGYLTKFEDLKEDTKTGEPCSVYHFPLHNLQRIDQELSLDQIHNTYLQNLLVKSHGLFIGSYRLNTSPNIFFTITYFHRFIMKFLESNRTRKVPSLVSRSFTERTGAIFPLLMYSYELIDIIDKTENKDASASRFPYRIRADAKLKISNQVTVTLPDVKTLDDCYRICHNSELFKCNTYSYCQYGDCRVSSLLTLGSYNESHVEQDKSCSIYTLNVVHDYAKVPQRKFKTQTSVAVDKSVDSCAESCHASPDCLSFQWCDYQCSFGTFYTDSSTEYDEECSIYLLPKNGQQNRIRCALH